MENSLEDMMWCRRTLRGLGVYFHWIVKPDWIKQFTNDNSSCFLRRALASWENIEDLIILGNTAVSRLAIFSFVIRHPISGVLLHHNYVCALLNDLFGIQARGGCACAGPYAQVPKIATIS